MNVEVFEGQVNGIDAVNGLLSLARAVREFEYWSTAAANLKRRIRDAEEAEAIVSLKSALRKAEEIADGCYRSMVNKAAIVLPKRLDTKCRKELEGISRDLVGEDQAPSGEKGE